VDKDFAEIEVSVDEIMLVSVCHGTRNLNDEGNEAFVV